MSEPAKTTPPGSSAARQAFHIRILAIAILVLGIAGAEFIFWRGTRTPDLPDDPSLLTNEKAASRQAAILYGNQAAVVQQWSDQLRRPGTMAIIVVVITSLVAGGCFYIARLIENDASRRNLQ